MTPDSHGGPPDSGAPDGAANAEPSQSESRRPRPPALTAGQVIPLMVVLVGLVGGMVVVAFGYWLVGCLIMGAFVGIGGLERLLLPKERAGLLQARSRFFDVIALIGMAVAIIALAIAVPR